MSTIVVSSFQTPDVYVQMEDIKIDSKRCRFTLNLSLSNDGKTFGEVEMISGTITPELREWMSIPKPVMAMVVANNEAGYEKIHTGKSLTPAQRYLIKTGWESKAYEPGAIESLTFTAHNTSDVYQDMPFRLFIGLDRCTLTLVNKPSRKQVKVYNEETATTEIKYKKKIGHFASGQATVAFIHKSEYRRLIIETTQVKEVYTIPHQD